MSQAAVRKLEVVAPFVTEAPAAPQRRLLPLFHVSVRRRHDEQAPVITVAVQARTMASARHMAKQQHPDTVVLGVTKL